MTSHFANNIAFSVQPDGTTHVRFMYTDPDSNIPDIVLCVIVMPNNLALQLSTNIAKGVTIDKQLVEKPSKKSKN